MTTRPIPGPRTVPRPLDTSMFISALAAGQVAGLVMGVVVMAVFALVLNQSLLYPLQVMGALFLGDAALTHVNLNILLGFLAHQAGPAFFWSLVFFAIVSWLKEAPGLSAALAIGLGVGVIAEIIDVYLFMPAVQQALNGHDIWREQVPRLWDWVAHAVYGLSLGFAFQRLLPPVEKSVERGERPRGP